MADKKHNDRVAEIAGRRHADEAPQVFKVGQMGSAQSGRRDFLKNALVGAAAGVSAAAIGGCGDGNPHSTQRVSDCTSTFPCSHNGGVRSLAIDSSGRLLASASDDLTVKLWSLPDGALLKTLTGHTGSVSAVAISPAGTMLASASDKDATVRLWSLPDGVFLKTLTSDHSTGVTSVAISPDGTLLASANAFTSTVDLWSLPDGVLLRTLMGHAGSVNTVAISPDGTLLASGSSDDTVKLWSLPNGGLLRTLTLSPVSLPVSLDFAYAVNAVAISPAGTMLVSASYDDTVELWSLPDGALLQTLTVPSSSVQAVAISHDETLLASGSTDKPIGLWSIPDGASLTSLVDPNCKTTTTTTCSPSGGARTGCTCDTVCSCDSVCTCNTVCTCDSQSGSSCGGSYYYPD